MCCFSREVESVTNTNIFARGGDKDRQFLVYNMTVKSKEDLAMILPIPVPSGSPDDAVRFIDLKEFPGFFSEMRLGFPEPQPKTLGRSRSLPAADSAPPKPLPVVEVGNFEASFVPSIADFVRLDERFRLPDTTWKQLPQYKAFGFAVFKLKKGAATIHPMAFEFPRANPKQLFFPTVHIHDGKVHAKAGFDHALYCQIGDDERAPMSDWRESSQLAGQFMDVKKSRGIVDGERHCYRRAMKGTLKNEDIIV